MQNLAEFLSNSYFSIVKIQIYPVISYCPSQTYLLCAKMAGIDPGVLFLFFLCVYHFCRFKHTSHVSTNLLPIKSFYILNNPCFHRLSIKNKNKTVDRKQGGNHIRQIQKTSSWKNYRWRHNDYALNSRQLALIQGKLYSLLQTMWYSFINFWQPFGWSVYKNFVTIHYLTECTLILIIYLK